MKWNWIKRTIKIASLLMLIGGGLLWGFSKPLQAQYSTPNYRAQGGALWVIGDGGTLQVDAGGIFGIHGRIWEATQIVASSTSTTKQWTWIGLDDDDLLFGTVNSSTTTYLQSAKPNVGYATFTFSAAPITSVTMSVFALKD